MTDPKPITAHQLRALEYLAQFDVAGQTSHFGTPHGMARWLWPDSPSWNRSGRNGVRGAFMPAKGGRVLSELRTAGLATSYYPPYDGSRPQWFITTRGREILDAARRVTTENEED